MSFVSSPLDRTLPSEAKKKVGELSDNSHQTLCTIQDVAVSISSVKMNKSPGIDGLSGDFYLALLPFHENLVARLLHAIFIESYAHTEESAANACTVVGLACVIMQDRAANVLTVVDVLTFMFFMFFMALLPMVSSSGHSSKTSWCFFKSAPTPTLQLS